MCQRIKIFLVAFLCVSLCPTCAHTPHHAHTHTRACTQTHTSIHTHTHTHTHTQKFCFKLCFMAYYCGVVVWWGGGGGVICEQLYLLQQNMGPFHIVLIHSVPFGLIKKKKKRCMVNTRPSTCERKLMELHMCKIFSLHFSLNRTRKQTDLASMAGPIHSSRIGIVFMSKRS